MIELLDDAGNVIGYYDGMTGETTAVDPAGATANAVAIWGSRQWNSQSMQPYQFTDGTQAVVGSDIMAAANYQTTGVVTPPLTAAQSQAGDAQAIAQGLVKVATGVYRNPTGSMVRYTNGGFVPYTGSAGLSMPMILGIGAIAFLALGKRGRV